MWLTIRQLVENGTTVFLTTQYLEEADRLADEIAILHGGRIVASGTPDELKAMVPTGLVELEFGEEAQLSAAQSARRAARGRPGGLELVVATTGSVAEMADMFIRLKDRGSSRPGSLGSSDAGRRVLQAPRRGGGGSACERSPTPGP